MKRWMLLVLTALTLAACSTSDEEASDSTLPQTDIDRAKRLLELRDIPESDYDRPTQQQLLDIEIAFINEFNPDNIERIFKELGLNGGEYKRSFPSDFNLMFATDLNLEEIDGAVSLINYAFYRDTVLSVGRYSAELYKLEYTSELDSDDEVEEQCYRSTLYNLVDIKNAQDVEYLKDEIVEDTSLTSKYIFKEANGETEDEVILYLLNKQGGDHLIYQADSGFEETFTNGVAFNAESPTASRRAIVLNDLCEPEEYRRVSIDITFDHLSPNLPIKDNNGVSSYYEWKVYFDVNRSNVFDAGDISFTLTHQFQEIDEDGITQPPIVQLDSQRPIFGFTFETNTFGKAIEYTRPPLIEELQYSNSQINKLPSWQRPFERLLSSYTRLNELIDVGENANLGTVTVNGNTLSLVFDTSVSPRIRYIDETTPIKVETYIRHDSADDSLFGDPATNDGPINWTSVEHRDAYPSPLTVLNNSAIPDFIEGFAENQSGVPHTDDTGDQIGEAKWADITSVTVTVSNEK